MCEAELDWVNERLTLYAVLFFYGKAASEALAPQIARDIATHWNDSSASVKIRGKQFSVQFNIEGIWSPSLSAEMVHENKNPRNNYFRIEEYVVGDISFVDGLNSNTGFFKLDNILDGSTTAAHEFGHTLGLDHPHDLDLRGKGIPGIMYPRGTLVDTHFQYNPEAEAGQPGGTINPFTRKVLHHDVDSLRLHEYNYVNNKTVIGGFTNIWHQAHMPA